MAAELPSQHGSHLWSASPQQAETVSHGQGVLGSPWEAGRDRVSRGAGAETQCTPPPAPGALSYLALSVALGGPPCRAPCPRTPGKDVTLEVPAGLPSQLAASRPPTLLSAETRTP